jgi:hypothetical protein
MNRTAAAQRVLVAAVALAFACRSVTIIPPSRTSWKRMDEIPHRREAIVLVIPPTFGEPAAVVGDRYDSVRFVVGPSLQAITRDFFEHAFARVVTSDTRPADAGAADFIVEPELSHFEASLSAWTSKYQFDIALRASVIEPGSATPLGPFTGVGKEAVVAPSNNYQREATLGFAVNSALQRAVADLVGTLARELPDRTVKAQGD